MAKIIYMDDRGSRPVESRKFLSEDELHTYLEQYPELLPLDELREDPPATVVIGREVGVPSGSIDLLLLDSEGRLTIIETKLAKNPEVRREVVGQIIEYASFVSRWDADEVERQANIYLHELGKSLRDVYDSADFQSAEEPFDEEAFRTALEDNLRRGDIRLVIAVDELSEALGSIVTFLNSFSTFEVVVLQLRDFELSSGKHVFIPSLFGHGTKAATATHTQRKKWDEQSLLEDAKSCRTPAEFNVIKELYALAKETGQIRFGTGVQGGSFSYWVSAERRAEGLLTVYNYGGIQLQLGRLLYNNVTPVNTLIEFRSRVNSIPGVHIPEDDETLQKYPSIPIEPLAEKQNLERFKDAVLWLRDEVLKVLRAPSNEKSQ